MFLVAVFYFSVSCFAGQRLAGQVFADRMFAGQKPDEKSRLKRKSQIIA